MKHSFQGMTRRPYDYWKVAECTYVVDEGQIFTVKYQTKRDLTEFLHARVKFHADWLHDSYDIECAVPDQGPEAH